MIKVKINIHTQTHPTLSILSNNVIPMNQWLAPQLHPLLTLTFPLPAFPTGDPAPGLVLKLWSIQRRGGLCYSLGLLACGTLLEYLCWRWREAPCCHGLSNETPQPFEADVSQLLTPRCEIAKPLQILQGFSFSSAIKELHNCGQATYLVRVLEFLGLTPFWCWFFIILASLSLLGDLKQEIPFLFSFPFTSLSLAEDREPKKNTIQGHIN